MKKRLVSVALVAALAAGTLAGCGSSSSGDNTQAAAGGETAGKGGSSDENITLRFAWWGGDERNEATLKVIEQFEAAHPNITIEAEYGGSDGYHDKLATQLASGTAADIVQVDPEVFPTYVSTGRCRNLRCVSASGRRPRRNARARSLCGSSNRSCRRRAAAARPVRGSP